MKTMLTVIVASGLLGCALARGRDGCCSNAPATDTKAAPLKGVPPSRVSIFQVPLQCLAAPQIGCGSRAKPMLLELEQDSNVSEAWLNRAGTKIAVVWKPESKTKARRGLVVKLKEQETTEIKGKSRDEAITDFLSGNGWYRGAEVDRLSEEEAGIIVARWVKRVEAKTILPAEKAEALQCALTDALKTRLTTLPKEKADAWTDALKKSPTDENINQDIRKAFWSEDGLQKVAGQYLDKSQIPILEEAIDAGVLALPNER